MVQFVEFEECLKIAFLNDLNVYGLEKYEEIFDLIIVNDGDFTVVKMILALVSGEDFDVSENSQLFELKSLILNS